MNQDCSRLRRELIEATSLLKMKWRVESSQSDVHKTLISKLDNLAKLEVEASAASDQIKKYAEENENLKQRCDRYSELINKMTAMKGFYQKTIEEMKLDKQALQTEIQQAKAHLDVTETKLKLQEELVKHLQTNLKAQLEQWDRDRAQFAKERLDSNAKEQKLIAKVKALEQSHASRTAEDQLLSDECKRLRDSLKETESRIPKLSELESIIRAKDNEVDVLRRRVKRLESELELLQDDLSLSRE